MTCRWTYVIAFTGDIERFMMVRSRKRGGWEMPGGRALPGENGTETSVREFMEETGHQLLTRDDLCVTMGKGEIFFGLIGEGDAENRKKDEIMEIGLFDRLPADLAYPDEEYRPLLKTARKMLHERFT